jgi:hypothetical protein
MRPCKTCQGAIAPEALMCPHCGASGPGRSVYTDGMHIEGLLRILGLISFAITALATAVFIVQGGIVPALMAAFAGTSQAVLFLTVAWTAGQVRRRL